MLMSETRFARKHQNSSQMSEAYLNWQDVHRFLATLQGDVQEERPRGGSQTTAGGGEWATGNGQRVAEIG